ncbi:SDR family oxidoreductase [Nocardioides sp.]|jgi:NAD(P)-dependent dehydrogenase (short-subunit alcohol dehydrogenase family)|uniref:SDR family oxidoreductase n=1 Tax=Nocardioides sp. TaxID=35761 RepID=UPI002B740021|nr:SDR family oxidoreductase [Nocardioides sp.]HVX55427.1 SDR family oxidoreductase [Nocardioides sp.]
MRHLVTGAGSGIGRVLAERLLARGDEVWAVVRRPGRAPRGCVEVVADLADAAAIESLREWPEAFDGLVHAAGVVELGPVADLGARAWQEQVAVNLVAPALLTRAVLPQLRVAYGTVVFVNSGSGLRANPEWAAYAASKFGLRALADALRAEEPDLRVTSVFPGRTATAMQEKVHRQEGREYDAGRWIRPETVAEVIVGVLDLSRDAQLPEVSVRPN